MKRWGIILIISILLVGIVSFSTAASITSSAISNRTAANIKDVITHAQANKLTNAQISKIIAARNAISEIKNGTCPSKCTCSGKVVKCLLANGTREMTIVAGNSGNVIFQVQDANASTKITLYKADDGKIYGVFKGNETRVVRMLPDQVIEKIKERIKAKMQDENITLNENGNYTYTAEKKARLFFIFSVKIPVKAEIDSETGAIAEVGAGKWWSFLARDENSEQLVGSSCGTVTPGYNDACCQNKGYDVWNQETG